MDITVKNVSSLFLYSKVYIVNLWHNLCSYFLKLTPAQLVLLVLFIEIIIFRFYFPVFFSPFDHIFSDPQRHWDNALQFNQLRIWGGIDPKGYQFFLAGLIHAFGAEWHKAIELLIGILCAATGFVWFLVARELVPRTQALLAGCVIGIIPSLLTIFGYFMNETLLLFLFGLAWWSSLVLERRPSVIFFLLVVTIWEWAALTRIIVLPVGAVIVSALWLFVIKGYKRKILAAIGCVFITAFIFFPMMYFTHERIGVSTPFSYGGLNKIYALSKTSKINMHIDNENWWCESPTFSTQPFDPISEFKLTRSTAYDFKIDTSFSTKNWDDEIKKLESHFSIEDYLYRVRDNVIYSSFATSWPDSGNNQGDGFWLVSGYHLRWIWAPLMIIVAAGALRKKFTHRQMIFVLAALGMIMLLFIQNEGIMEGRYRKPVEPMLIISAIIVCMSKKQVEDSREGAMTFFQFVSVVLRKLNASFKGNQLTRPVICK